MDDWKYIKMLRQHEKRGIWAVVAAVAAILAVAAAICLIVKHVTKKSCCCEDCFEEHFDEDDDFEDDPDGCEPEDKSGDCDENGCCYTNDKDFI